MQGQRRNGEVDFCRVEASAAWARARSPPLNDLSNKRSAAAPLAPKLHHVTPQKVPSEKQTADPSGRAPQGAISESVYAIAARADQKSPRRVAETARID